MTKEEKKNRRIVYISIFISLFFHVLIAILLNYRDLWSFSREEIPEELQPLELVFEQPAAEPEPQPNIPDQFYELVENPNATEDAPDASNKLSTASSLSQAPVIQPGEIREVPGEFVEDPQQSASAEEEAAADPLVEEQVQNALLAYRENRSFDRSALTGEKNEKKEIKEEKSSETTTVMGESPNRPEGFNADLVGDFALSTYEWEWAPYWLEFKRKLMRVWFAPPAYYELGLIHGHTIVRLKVNRAGVMYDLEVLRQVGHHSLQESSVSALNAAFPFKALPDDFRDEYLEVTIKMVYPDLRQYRAQQ